MSEPARHIPAAVIVAAACLGLLIVGRLAGNAVPAVLAEKPGAWGDLIAALVALAIPAGLLARQRWAWWLGVCSAALLLGTALLSLPNIEHFQRVVDLDSRRAAAALLALFAVLSFTALLCLIARGSRRAFTSHR